MQRVEGSCERTMGGCRQTEDIHCDGKIIRSTKIHHANRAFLRLFNSFACSHPSTVTVFSCLVRPISLAGTHQLSARVTEQMETDRAIVMVCFSSSGEMALSAFLCRTKSSWICCVAIKLAIGRYKPDPARTSEIVSVTSMLPVFAPSIRHRKASNLSVDGGLMSDFGLYRLHVEGTSRGKVTSVCMGKSTTGTLRATAAILPGKGHFLIHLRESRSRYPSGRRIR
jgi:hypothetical protein